MWVMVMFERYLWLVSPREKASTETMFQIVRSIQPKSTLGPVIKGVKDETNPAKRHKCLLFIKEAVCTLFVFNT